MDITHYNWVVDRLLFLIVFLENTDSQNLINIIPENCKLEIVFKN